jgi:aryl-alcohol dehydrogenase-like predicted oxidoreductase
MLLNYNDWINKITLGTVQFGLDYGISNKSGKILPAEADAILKYAFDKGIATLDTAACYGTSEKVLGSVIEAKKYNFNIVTKFSPDTTPENFDNVLNGSLQKLHTARISGYMSHDFKAFKNASLRQTLTDARNKGLVQKIGVSVYFPSEIIWLLEENVDFDIIQLPFNIFDQRFRPLFAELKKRNVEIFIRSVFLQGLFYIPVDELPDHFNSVKNTLAELHKLSEIASVPLSALLLNYAIMQKEIDKVVIGVSGLKDLRENLNAYEYIEQSFQIISELDRFAISDEQIILPFNWK